MKNSKMIRILALLLVFSFLVFAFAGCSFSKEDEDTADESVQGGSTTYQQYMGWLKQYDKWTESYINVCKNYNKNPVAYMSDYMTKTAELTEWTAKFSDIEDDDLTATEAAKISAEYLRIYNKMMKAVSEIN